VPTEVESPAQARWDGQGHRTRRRPAIGRSGQQGPFAEERDQAGSWQGRAQGPLTGD
jgi:hypothetical protein